MYPASITKILTCIVAIEMLDDLDKTATITQSDIDTVWEQELLRTLLSEKLSLIEIC